MAFFFRVFNFIEVGGGITEMKLTEGHGHNFLFVWVIYRKDRPRRPQKFGASMIFRQLAHEGGKGVSPIH
jgi:hypothetical protein